MLDSDIWINIKKGEKSSLKQLHEKYFHQMYLYAVHETDESGLAEELVNDCFIKIWENRRKIDIHSCVKNYLFLMLRNSIVDQHRKRKLQTVPLSNELQTTQFYDDELFFDDQKKYARLYQAVKKLPYRRREVLELATFESLSHNEIAEKLSISKSTVKNQMVQAYKSLSEMLDPKDFSFFLLFKK